MVLSIEKLSEESLSAIGKKSLGRKTKLSWEKNDSVKVKIFQRLQLSSSSCVLQQPRIIVSFQQTNVIITLESHRHHFAVFKANTLGTYRL